MPKRCAFMLAYLSLGRLQHRSPSGVIAFPPEQCSRPQLKSLISKKASVRSILSPTKLESWARCLFVAACIRGSSKLTSSILQYRGPTKSPCFWVLGLSSSERETDSNRYRRGEEAAWILGCRPRRSLLPLRWVFRAYDRWNRVNNVCLYPI